MKTTDDLLVIRSDVYELTSDGRMRPGFDGPGPVVTLDKDFPVEVFGSSIVMSTSRGAL